MPDPLAWAYAAPAGIVAGLAFRDAPQRLLSAHREGRVLQSGLYHAVNAVSIVVILAWVALVLLGVDRSLLPGGSWQPAARGAGVGLAWAGFALSAWARLSLAGAFSPTAAVPSDGEIVEAGPFAHVRHPFYVGLMVALFAGALALDSAVTLVAAIVMVPLVGSIARLEEHHLEAELGAAYRSYRERVPRWVPRLGD